jgi:pimeloyl-ACP methyl ester carboxylesterase
MNLREDPYRAMQGPEWNVTGHLKDWDVTDRLGELNLPVLFTWGRHDEMTSTLVQPVIDRIRGAEYALFEESAHLAMAEEPERYRRVVESFLSRVDASQA